MKCQQEKVYEIIQKAPLRFEVKEPGAEYIIDLKERTFEFAVAIIDLLKTVPYEKENDVIRYQLAKSGTSVGANYEEAQATSSKADFRHKISIVLKETRESNYWLRIMRRTQIGNQETVVILVQESYELRNIFGSIYNKVKD
jgi:four helix bundle protein